jgi:predicted N-formylglutamate amidohydrolase
MLLKREKGLAIGGNEHYRATDESDYTIPVHGEQRSLHHVAVEVRRDLIVTVWVSKRGKRCSQVCCRRRTAN